MNRSRLVNLAALASAVALAGAANAQTAPAPAPAAAAPAPADPLSYNIGVVTDYRYRAISQSRLKPALQGGADYAFESGAYVGTWASTISWIKDAGKIAGVDTGSVPLEIDLYGGYKGEITKGVAYDVGGLYYLYAGNKYDKIPGASKADTFEVYGAVTYGIFTAKLSYSLTNLFGTGGGSGADKSTGSTYLDLSANYDAGDGWTITPHVGRQQITHYNVYSYTDYGLTVAKDMGKGVSLSAALIQADVKKIGGTAVYASPAGKNLGKGTVVLGAKYTF
jgi:uncharacterized protein (TIGR02001 family)